MRHKDKITGKKTIITNPLNMSGPFPAFLGNDYSKKHSRGCNGAWGHTGHPKPAVMTFSLWNFTQRKGEDEELMHQILSSS